MNKKFFPIIVLALILVVGGVAGYILFSIQRQRDMVQAKSLLIRGNHQGVVDLLSSRVDNGSYAPEERLIVAQALYRMRQYEQAQDVLNPLLRPGEEHPEALALSGWIWIKLGSYLQAKSRFDRIAEFDMADESEGGLGAVALLRSEGYKSSDLNEAEIHLKKAIDLGTKIPQVYLTYSELKIKQNNFKEAIEYAKHAADLAPRWSEPYVMLGRSYLLNSNYKEAEEAFQTGLEYGASQSETTYYLARSTYLQGRLNDAYALLKELSDQTGDIQRSALIDASKIAQVIDPDRSIGYLQKAWSIREDPLVGLQLYSLLTRNNALKEAQDLLNDLVGKWPFFTGLIIEKSHQWLEQNDLSRAFSGYYDVIESDPENFIANFNLGCIAMFREEYRYRATDFFEAVIRNYEEFFPAQVNLVLARLVNNQSAEADSHLKALIERYPDKPFLYLARAVERYISGDPSGSIESLEQSLKLEPDQASPFVIQGEIRLRLFQFEEARDNFEKALELDPSNARARLGAAHTYYRLGDYRKASQLYNQLASDQRGLSKEFIIEIMNGQALIHFQQDEYPAAKKLWDELSNQSMFGRQVSVINQSLEFENSPTSAVLESLFVRAEDSQVLPETLYNLANYLEKQDRIEEAIQQYESLVTRFPSYLPGLYNLANLYRQEGNYGEAITLYEQVRRAAPTRIDVLSNEAAAYMMIDDVDTAEQLVDQSVEVDPNYSDLRYNQVVICLRQGELDQAKEIYRSFKEFSPHSTATMQMQGLIYLYEEQWEQAEEGAGQCQATKYQ